MNLPGSLFSSRHFREPFDAWLAHASATERLQRASSHSVYLHMWTAFSEWAIGSGLTLDELTAEHLEAYVASRGGSAELTARYAWRLLRLVERVLVHRLREAGRHARNPATEALERHPLWRYANDPASRSLPEHLSAAEAARLVTCLSEAASAGGAPPSWQTIRDKASVGAMLGAGITPGEVRLLKLPDAIVAGGRTKGIPWRLSIPGSGATPSRQTPLAAWAGRLLKQWLDTRSSLAIPGPMLFPSTRSSGKAWGKVAQYNSARQVLAAAGLEHVEGGSYRLRHTFALRQLRRGHSEEDVARWIGVSDPMVMERYRRVLAMYDDVV